MERPRTCCGGDGRAGGAAALVAVGHHADGVRLGAHQVAEGAGEVGGGAGLGVVPRASHGGGVRGGPWGVPPGHGQAVGATLHLCRHVLWDTGNCTTKMGLSTILFHDTVPKKTWPVSFRRTMTQAKVFVGHTKFKKSQKASFTGYAINILPEGVYFQKCIDFHKCHHFKLLLHEHRE